MSTFYSFARGVVAPLFAIIFGRMNVLQKEKLPKSEKGYVIACTHTGWVDILALGLAASPTQIHFMAKKELFENKLVGWLMTKLNAFPVDRENPGPSAIKIPMRLIKEGNVVGIFPSGTRTEEDVPLKRGAVTIASYAKAPIVPAAYYGPNNFKEMFKKRGPRIIFGDPIYLDENLSKKEALDKLANDLDQALKDLKKQVY